MSSQLAKLQVKIINLSAEDRLALINYIQSTLQFQGKPAANEDKISDALKEYLTDAVRRYCIKRGFTSHQHSWAIIRHGLKDLPEYSKENLIVRQWLENNCEPKSEAERQYLAELGVKALALRLEATPTYYKTGIKPYDLLKNILQIPTALSWQFPGYADSGLLKLLIRRGS